MDKYNKNTFTEFLNNRWKGKTCPMCGAAAWNVSDEIYELREFHNGDIVLGAGPILPIIPVTCMDCGNTIFVNAMVSNAISNKPKESDSNGNN